MLLLPIGYGLYITLRRAMRGAEKQKIDAKAESTLLTCLVRMSRY